MHFTLDADWLRSAPFVRLMDAISPLGEARVVGGAVRDALLGEPVGDIDLATAALPADVARAAAAAGLAVHGTGLAHGTLTVVASGRPFEVTTLREDVATDGRRATVLFTDDFAADAARRDFTLNALYLDRDGNGTDYVGGHADCLARRVRFIGDADRRIREDHLRILRFFRFNAAYAEGPPDADGLAACVRHRDTLGALSVERVAHELTRTLAAPRAPAVVALMAADGFLDRFVPPPHDVARFATLAMLEHTYRPRTGAAEDGSALASYRATPVLGFAALVSRDLGRFEAAAATLKLSRRERDRGVAAIAAARRMPPWSPRETRALLYDAGAEAFVDGLLISAAGWIEGPPLRPLLAAARSWTQPRLPVGGNDLLAQGGTAGPALGTRLARLEAAWRGADFTLDRKALLMLDRTDLAAHAAPALAGPDAAATPTADVDKDAPV